MSKNYPEKEVNVNDLSGEELGALASDETEPEAPKRIFSRILALLLALAPIALVCFLPALPIYAAFKSGSRWKQHFGFHQRNHSSESVHESLQKRRSGRTL